MASKLSPMLNHLHNIAPMDAEEEGPLMAMTGQSVTLFTIFPAPRYVKWYLNSDKKPAYAMLKLALQVRMGLACMENHSIRTAAFLLSF